MKTSIRIAAGQGFWGDLQRAPVDQVTHGQIDYLVMDYLAEVTMSIMQKQKQKDPALGYARDFVSVIEKILPDLMSKNIKVIANAGGVNPFACRDAVMEVAKKLGITGLKIGVVHGDDILKRLPEFLETGIELENMDTGESIWKVQHRLLSANVYFGAFPIVEALDQGAQIVITGRCTDTGLTLAPMIHEFGWKNDDWDLLAAGTVAGHILECGAQASGGNFLGDWKSVPDFANIGFPIAEAHPDGTFIITKHESLGGLVNTMTVKEQLLYEIGDPTQYIGPDVVADFTSIQVEAAGENRVKVFGIKGRPNTPFYKVSASYEDGYFSSSTLVYSWPDAAEKAKAAGEILKKRLDLLGFQFDEYNAEYIGMNSCHGHLADKVDDYPEVMLRVSVRGSDKKSMTGFGMEIAPLILTGPPAVTGFAGGRPKPSDIVAYWPALIPKTVISPKVEVTG